ncbi:MAG: hypothetical protein CUN56_04545 [Phototrophicales bacterium]|nr:MAG: hypothetical protein CUN56_04545 [Phototrophicales bacterium]RMG77351.1 MAG: hypothetical protein D6711_01825 [Chloroflexota bacterium]
MQANNEELLNLAIRAAKSGNKEGARVMLRQVYSRDRRNITAMLWLAKIARNTKERIQWLERILQQDPSHAVAQQTLQRIYYKQQAAENRQLLLFGIVAVFMIVTVIAMYVIVS